MSVGAFLLMGTPGSGGSSSPPATPALAVADNGDGTGAVATISGSATGSTNTVYTAPWAAAGNNLTWAAATPRTGDGTVALSLADGFYVARCESTVGGIPAVQGAGWTEPVFQVTGGSTYTSVHKALAESVANTIRGMLGTSIIGPVADSVRVRKVPWTNDYSSISPIPADKTHALPAIIVTYFDTETFDPTAGVNIRDDIGYPLAICFQQANNGAGQAAAENNDDSFLRWREAVERTFTHLRGVTSNAGKKGYLDVTANGVAYTFHNCIARPGTIFDWNRWKSDAGSFDFGWLLFTFIVRRPGGA